MFTVLRSWYKNGNEGDEVEITYKEFTTLEKAKAYVYRYAKGIKYVCSEIQDEKGNTIFEHYAGE